MDFLSKRPFFSLLPPHFWGKRRTLLLHPTIRRFRLRTSLRADVHAPAHRALSEFAIPAFTFTRNPLIQCVLWVMDCALFAFTCEGKRGESFTHKSLMHSFLRPCGEEVKAKNEKRRTRV